MRQYETAEFVFQGPEPSGSFVDVDVKGIFTTGDETKEVKGFYAGDGVYKVRFLPEEAGEYTYTVKGVVSGEGSFTAEPAEKGSVDHGHGIVRADGTHFKYADGNWFYPFGTTVYALAHQTDELMDETIDTLSKSPFNKVRMCVFPKHYHYNHNDPKYFAFQKKEDGSWDVNHPDFRFWDAFEDKIRRLGDLDIQVDLILFHPYDRWGFESMPQKDNLVYLDYLLRRFAAIPNIWWSLSNEYDLCGDKTMEDWYGIEEYVAENDPYHHLLGNHNCFTYWDATRKNITHSSLQIKLISVASRQMSLTGKPVSVDECRYEGDIEESWGDLSGQDMTLRFWEAVTIGAYCTHGETFLDRTVDPDDAVVWWSKGGKLIGESPARIQFLKDIAESLPGPIEEQRGFGSVFSMTPEQFDAMKDQLPAEYRNFIRRIVEMDPVQKIYQQAGEYTYAGHVGEDAYLWYYDTQCCRRARINLPTDGQYKVEVIDTWNMTRSIVVEGVSGSFMVTLPGHEYMAILATKMKDEVRMLG